MPGAAPRMTRATLAPMTGKIGAYDHLPETARAIREQVFIRERDWRPEFDEWDAVAVHLLAFDGNRTVATCRFYADPDHSDQPGRYVIARLAVLPDAQGRGIGSQLLADAERRIAHSAGTSLCAGTGVRRNIARRRYRKALRREARRMIPVERTV